MKKYIGALLAMAALSGQSEQTSHTIHPRGDFDYSVGSGGSRYKYAGNAAPKNQRQRRKLDRQVPQRRKAA